MGPYIVTEPPGGRASSVRLRLVLLTVVLPAGPTASRCKICGSPYSDHCALCSPESERLVVNGNT
jgi:hypothetical protein